MVLGAVLTVPGGRQASRSSAGRGSSSRRARPAPVAVAFGALLSPFHRWLRRSSRSSPPSP